MKWLATKLIQKFREIRGIGIYRCVAERLVGIFQCTANVFSMHVESFFGSDWRKGLYSQKKCCHGPCMAFRL
jgi:hypothetical protein